MESGDQPRHRVAVIGDVGGHLQELRSELCRLGGDEQSGRLPDDLTVIQVGDLVHRGPDSAGVVALVDGYLTRQPDRWVQLVGNHEAQYLRPPLFEWPERIDTATAETIRRWWADGQLVVAAAVESQLETFLVTHAGLTAHLWAETLGAPASAEQAAVALNQLIGSGDEVLFRPGQMLHGKKRDRYAGPLWADAATELVPGWLGTVLPFSQVHGHATLFDWQHRRFRVGSDLALLTTVDEDAKHEFTLLRGGRIIGVDPGHGRRAQRPWRAWEVTV